MTEAIRWYREWDLVLIGCGKAKRPEESPAIDLYTGPVFPAADQPGPDRPVPEGRGFRGVSTFPIPPGFAQVPKEQFYATLYADPRDIMPTVENSDSFSNWQVVKGHELWGRSFPGWKNPGDPEAYFIKAT